MKIDHTLKSFILKLQKWQNIQTVKLGQKKIMRIKIGRRVRQVKSINTERRQQYLRQKEATRVLIQSRLHYFIERYSVVGIELRPSGRIAIRDSKTRWGSCSSKGNLNFHWKLGVIPAYLSDYVIVHELCHLKEFNHGTGFWNLVAQVCPEYEKYRLELRQISLR